MVAILRGEWTPAMSWEQLIALCDRLDALLREIRTSRNILPPMGKCPHCGTVARQAEPRVSVRATILALGRFGITDQVQVKALEKGWRKFREETGADLYGKVAGSHPAARADGMNLGATRERHCTAAERWR